MRAIARRREVPAHAHAPAAVVDLDLPLIAAPDQIAAVHRGAQHLDAVGLVCGNLAIDVRVLAAGEAKRDFLDDLE